MKAILVPAAIILGCGLIAASLFFREYPTPLPQAANQPTAKPVAQQNQLPDVIENADVRRSDSPNIYGNPEAQITIVEFSDFECPFCARLEPTLKRIVDESDGRINWEYRHLPLPMHATALPAAIASECVAASAGNEAFWKFSGVLLANLGKANTAFLKAEAVKLGVPAATYDACLAGGEAKSIVDADSAFIVNEFGGQGTPFSLVVNNSDKTARPVSGALPYDNWMQVIERIK